MFLAPTERWMKSPASALRKISVLFFCLQLNGRFGGFNRHRKSTTFSSTYTYCTMFWGPRAPITRPSYIYTSGSISIVSVIYMTGLLWLNFNNCLILSKLLNWILWEILTSKVLWLRSAGTNCWGVGRRTKSKQSYIGYVMPAQQIWLMRSVGHMKSKVQQIPLTHTDDRRGKVPWGPLNTSPKIIFSVKTHDRTLPEGSSTIPTNFATNSTFNSLSGSFFLHKHIQSPTTQCWGLN